MSIRHEPDDVRVICTMTGLGRHPLCMFRRMAQPASRHFGCTQRRRTILVPERIVLRILSAPAQGRPCGVSQHAYSVGQPHSSVIVARADLARPTYDMNASAQDPVASWRHDMRRMVNLKSGNSSACLRKMVQPYLNDGRPDVAFVAEMAGVSTRTLQRRLMLCGSSYSQIFQEARFELACSRLDDPMKVIDVAMMAGYESPQHFTRAFRRFTGVTPSEYRHHNFARARASSSPSTRKNASIVIENYHHDAGSHARAHAVQHGDQ